VSPQSAPVGAPQDELSRRREYAQANFGTDARGIGRIYVRYGPPDQIEDRSTDAQNPSQIWRYKYLEDFHSNVEFEFAPGRGVHINWPLPVTYEGAPSQAVEQPQDDAAQPLRASMQIYPAKGYSILSFPLDFVSGDLDVIAQIVTRAAGTPVANARDYIRSPGTAGTYQVNFSLEGGSYVCRLLVRDVASGRMYTETINFEVQ
jgi:hypothetical protein